ncbi:hypothetical protein J2Y48_001254 [Mycoplana sp. BE70]|uniref:hypothetical protein n=1 Tax=Mycoplana sp. BE70 TaxID=2817775 RepID=UPI00285DAEBF|nr:hypothetical protein [Mycoplana sp. BE70]MDR6755964.1 hypothetical protein [Mycoplana sp. BE70]
MTSNIPNRSRRLRNALALAAALPLMVAPALPAHAQDAGHPARAETQSGDRDRMERGYRHEAHGRDRDRGPRRWHGANFAERLATRLAAAETAAGIKTAQLDAWRTFTAALVDFATPQRASMASRDQAGDEGAMKGETLAPTDEQQAAQTPPAEGTASGRAGPSGLDFLDRMIARAETRAEKAEKLKAAKSALEAVLEPGQKEVLERFLLPPRRSGGRD